MSLFLVQVGKATWVALMPSRQSSGAATTTARGSSWVASRASTPPASFRDLASAETPNNAEACTNALLACLGKADIARNQLNAGT
jgi:hypothetical protein